jgi:FtsH-binding integral membrane protein
MAAYQPLPDPETENADAQDVPRMGLLKDAEREIRIGFVRKVYGILSAQLLLTVMIAYPICSQGPVFVQSNMALLNMSTVMLFVALFAQVCCSQATRKYPTNYVILFVFTACMGVNVGFVSAMYTWKSIMLAAGMTTGIFVRMTIYANTTKSDFTGMGPYMVGALICLIVLSLVATLLWCLGVYVKPMMMLIDACGVLLFTFFLVYDTQMVMGNKGLSLGVDEYVFAAMQIYVDIINLFLYLLQLFGDQR